MQNDAKCHERWFLALLLSCVLWLAGCSGANLEQQRAQQAQELARLQDENKELQKLRTENKELPRLRKDNEELAKLRESTGEIDRLQKENDRIKSEIAELAKARRQSQLAAQQARQAAAQSAAARAAAAGQPILTATNVADPNAPQEGDQIFIDPKLLASLLPQFDWSKLKRKEPIDVRPLLEQQGFVLTNYQQLISLGITNYTLQRSPKPPASTRPAPQ
ncbi:MAG: hypothetical protein HY735_20365 [Verrucomicrobia bacterium]|nr:hypothetical protein [Verrucomicrobiota bacterium]